MNTEHFADFANFLCLQGSKRFLSKEKTAMASISFRLNQSK
ncbi:hypothetical protein S7335_234 [Synechococcus sp. PCC 7335]|nr:hypothetical protein S7335_234 [Synechococcus sp. PCC 7335]